MTLDARTQQAARFLPATTQKIAAAGVRANKKGRGLLRPELLLRGTAAGSNTPQRPCLII
jgi:hypothetical protein